jgi:hypothetical protein
VELAAVLFPDAATPFDLSRTNARVKSWLVKLEEQGDLVSRLAASPNSGNGLRYFRLVTKASAAPTTTIGGGLDGI